MRDRVDQLLKIGCFALGALVLFQVGRAVMRNNPLERVSIPAVPTLDAGNLFVTSWNAHGGVGRILFDPTEWILLIGAAATSASTLSCRNSVGTATSSFGCVWEEDI